MKLIDKNRKKLSYIKKFIKNPVWNLRFDLAKIGVVLHDNERKIVNYKNKHRNERCFIIGNGPSLLKTDLSKLKNEITFGLNRIYLNYKNMNFKPTYYMTVNPLVVEQFYEDINDLTDSVMFIPYIFSKYFHNNNIIFYRHLTTSIYGISTNLVNGLCLGATVTFAALELAYYMGFTEVILIGVDHNFREKGLPNETVISKEGDANHFSKDYFGKGVKWQLPDYELSEENYRSAKLVYEQDNRKIYNATLGTKLEVFKKIDYNKLWK